MRRRTVQPPVQEKYSTICGKQYRVMIYQISKTVWEAHAEYGNGHIKAKGATPGSAFSFWESQANAIEFD
ncbi:MAG TPA: hypothetical protein VNX28_17260 [Gemmataceae bacterium]|jgi:hypothetical protein|nr:hypothetical protein [Gemmataceae bacterium]